LTEACPRHENRLSPAPNPATEFATTALEQPILRLGNL
jgi:hypothetical protein